MTPNHLGFSFPFEFLQEYEWGCMACLHVEARLACHLLRVGEVQTGFASAPYPLPPGRELSEDLGSFRGRPRRCLPPSRHLVWLRYQRRSFASPGLVETAS